MSSIQSRATWNLDTNSAFALGPRKTTENLDRVVTIISLTFVYVDDVRTSQEAYASTA
jgi:hypothetical protein